MGKFVSDKKKAQAVEPIKLDQDAVKFLKQFHALAREYRVNQIAGNAAIVTQTAAIAGAWNTAAGTPITDILTGMGVVYNATAGFTPNRILMTVPVALKIIQTTEWQEYFKYRGDVPSTGDALFNAVSGLANLGLEVMLTSIHGLSEYKCTASDPHTESLWDDNVLLFYCEPTPSMETRTFMYSPYVVKDQVFSTRVPRRRGVYHDIYSDIDELLVDASCGYLMTNVL